MPRPLLDYITKVYDQTEVWVGDAATTQGKGVLQEDCLSPFCFKACVDYIFQSPNPVVGVEVGGTVIPTIAFADDIVVLASSRAGLDLNLQRLVAAAGSLGLTLGYRKCATLGLDWLGRQKKLANNMTPFILDGTPLPTLNSSGMYKYLGIEMTSGGPRKWVGAGFREQVGRLGRAALKPQQKLFLLRNYLLPKHIYRLKHEHITIGALRELDRTVRAEMRRFLHLPKDTPVPFFHLKPCEEGLGVPELETTIALQLTKLKANLAAAGGLWESVSEVVAVPVSERTRRRAVIEFCDGRGLASSSKRSGCYSWISDGTTMMKGSEFIEAIKVRLGVCYTKERNTRGRDVGPQDRICDLGCRRIKDLGHILQECPATAPFRDLRHNRVADVLKNTLANKG